MKKISKKKQNLLLKKVGIFFKKALVTGLISGVLVFGGMATKEGIESAKYTSSAVITETLTDFGIDNPYILVDALGNYRRLANNGDEPIYVSFDQGYEKNPKYKELAIKSLDYIFGIVGNINPLYRYEVVSPEKRAAYEVLGKTTIKYVSSKFDTTGRKYLDGVAYRIPTAYDIAYWDNIGNKGLIAVDFNHFSGDENEYIQYVFTHELLHVFGLSDVYENKVVKGEHVTDGIKRQKYDTFMQGGILFEDSLMITPKDYASLCALYVSKTDVSNPEMISFLQQKIYDYTQKYYQNIDERCYNKLNEDYYIYKELRCPEGDLEFDYKETIYLASNLEISAAHIYKFYTSNGHYIAQIYDEQGALLDECSGKVQKSEHFLILRDCNFKHGKSPLVPDINDEGGYINNLCVWQSNNYVGVFFDGGNINRVANNFNFLSNELQ